MSDTSSKTLDDLLTEIMLEYVVEADTPPQIVSIPDSDAQYEYLTVCLSKQAIEVLGKLAEARYANPAAAARVILNVLTAYIHQRTQSGNPG